MYDVGGVNKGSKQMDSRMKAVMKGLLVRLGR